MDTCGYKTESGRMHLGIELSNFCGYNKNQVVSSGFVNGGGEA